MLFSMLSVSNQTLNSVRTLSLCFTATIFDDRVYYCSSLWTRMCSMWTAQNYRYTRGLLLTQVPLCPHICSLTIDYKGKKILQAIHKLAKEMKENL